MTKLQKAVYEWSKGIECGEELEFKNDIEKLNTLDDVYNYYAYSRDWANMRSLMEALTWLLVDLARKGF
jgi:hypothetical protein